MRTPTRIFFRAAVLQSVFVKQARVFRVVNFVYDFIKESISLAIGIGI